MKPPVILAAAVALIIAAGNAGAVVLEDFDGLAPGMLDGTAGWHADSDAARIGRDFTNAGNQFWYQAGRSNNIYRGLGEAAVADESTSTLFFRFFASSSGANHAFGLSDVAVPQSRGDFEVGGLVADDGGNVKLQAASGGGYVDLSENGGAGNLDVNTWYNVWMVADNTADRADYYIQGGGIETQRKVGSGLPFHNGAAANDLVSFYAQTVGSNKDSVLIDDIHLSAGTVLSNPAPVASPPALEVPSLFQFAEQNLAATDQVMTSDWWYPSSTLSTGPWQYSTKIQWTSGFFPGMLWQMYRRTGDEAWRATAAARTSHLESQKLDDSIHDVGFQIFNSFGRGYAATGNEEYKDVILTAADTLATRFNPTVGAIQSWGDKETGYYTVIIDNMMNLELLFWASKNGGDASLYDIAVQHALKTHETLVRPDGSTYHTVRFDRNTGDVITKASFQGYATESTWSRGQAWGVYGFTMTYRETGDPRFLDTARNLADYFIDNLPADHVSYYDFDAPGTPSRDSSAAAITASALMELATLVDAPDRQRYTRAGEKILLSLAGPGFLSDGSAFKSLLQHGTTGKNGRHDIGLIFGDYYFLEALERYEASRPAVTSQHVFYHNSAFEDPPHNAVATDKRALLPGETASFENYTSYDLGINGILVDVANFGDLGGLSPETIGDYFEFRVGNDNTPDDWQAAPDILQVSVQPEEGEDGADRVAIVWADREIQNEWLEVTVLANELTGLVDPYVFYFGNAVAESGNLLEDAQVTPTDLLLPRNNPRSFLDPAAVDFPYDYNRDGRVNATDVLLARNNQTNFLTSLKLITVPGETAATVVPEPSTLVLLVVGALGLAAYGWRKLR